MLFNLFLPAASLLVFSIIAMVSSSHFSSAELSNSSLFGAVPNMIATALAWASLALAALSLVFAFFSFFRLWKWSKNEVNSCSNCGGITTFKTGRYGPYDHCLQCGKNRSIK